MSFDIYGQRLRPGHCEVHPEVDEEYPCSECDDEYARDQYYEDEYDKYCDKYCEELANEHYKQIEEEHNYACAKGIGMFLKSILKEKENEN